MLAQAPPNDLAGRLRGRPGYAGAARHAGASGAVGTLMSFPRDAEIYGEGDPAGTFYEVLGGAVRTCRIMADGRRQIGDFYLPGDVFGFEGGKEHVYSAEAVAGCKVVAMPRRAFDGAGEGEQLLRLAVREIERAQNHVLLLVKSAHARVAAFLLDMAARSAARTGFDLPGLDLPAFELPMSRQDIADYLGLTIETVSRTLTGFEAAALIALPSARRVVLRDRAALNRLNA